MGLWKIVKPEATTNLITNPSFEVNVSDGWTLEDAGAGAAVEQRPRSWFGAYSVKLTAGTGNCQIKSNDITLANGETLYAQAQLWQETASTASLFIYDSTNSTARGTADDCDTIGGWEHLETYWTNDTGGPVTVVVKARNNAADSASRVWIDAVQAEIDTSTYTTYIDGDQPGGAWTGTPHNSTSTRDADAWQGGREYDLADDYSFVVQTVTGADAPPVEVFGTPYAILPGEAADGERIAARDLFIMGEIYSNTSFADLQSKKAAFFDEIKHWRSGQTTRNSDPVKLRYAGSERTLEIEVKYVGGFEGTHSARDGWSQRFTLHFRAQEDVWWHSINRVASVLDHVDSGTARYAVAKVDGLWTTMGPPNAPSGGSIIYDMVHNGRALYVASEMTNWDGQAGADYFFKWNGASWEPVASGGEGTALVSSLLLGPDGVIVLGGDFINWGTVAAADYAITYDPDADSYDVLGTGPTSGVQDLAIDPSTGYIYAALATDVEYWDGSSWTGLTPGDFAQIYGLTFTPNGTLHVVGNSNDGNDHILYKTYDGSTWTTIVQGTANAESLYSVAALSDGRTVVGGDFASIDGVTAGNIAIYNGQTFDDMDGGFTGGSDLVWKVIVDEDDLIYATGVITEAGSESGVMTNVSIYNGHKWLRLDWEASSVIYTIAFDDDDLYLGGTIAGVTAYYSGDTTITTIGGRPINPRLKIKRSGGTSATLYYLQNVDTKQEIWFDLNILDGETITIDFAARTITSDFGRKITGNPLPGSSGLGAFEMDESSNLLNLWVDTAGSPTITAIMDYWVNYDGYSGGDT